MKKLILVNVLFGLIVSGAHAKTEVRPFKESLDLIHERPSCELLAWRWANYGLRLDELYKKTLKADDEKSFEEVRQISKRIAEENAEEGLEKVVQTVTFRVPGVNSGNFRWTSVKAASFAWVNVTENTTDLMGIEVTEGHVKVSVAMNYADYCFMPDESILKIEVNGRPQSLVWNTRHTNLDKYFAEVKRSK